MATDSSIHLSTDTQAHKLVAIIEHELEYLLLLPLQLPVAKYLIPANRMWVEVVCVTTLPPGKGHDYLPGCSCFPLMQMNPVTSAVVG